MHTRWSCAFTYKCTTCLLFKCLRSFCVHWLGMMISWEQTVLHYLFTFHLVYDARYNVSMYCMAEVSIPMAEYLSQCIMCWLYTFSTNIVCTVIPGYLDISVITYVMRIKLNGMHYRNLQSFNLSVWACYNTGQCLTQQFVELLGPSVFNSFFQFYPWDSFWQDL